MRKSITLAAALTAAAGLAAWGGAERASSAASQAAAANDTFVYASQNSIVTDFDPATSYSNEVIAMNNIYEQLTRYDARAKKVTPLLATSWKSSHGGKTWTFVLRKGVRFHTGRPVTAQAARSAILRTKKLKGGAAYIWDSVASIATPNAQTLVFHLKYPAPLDLISSSAYAAYVYDTKAAGSQNEAAWFKQAHDAGSGPYVVSKWQKGQQDELRLEPFKAYWRGWKGVHYQHVLYQFVPQATTRFQELQSGAATFSERLSPQLFAAGKAQRNLQTEQRPSWQNLLAMLNTASGPLADVRVRRAVLQAVDYQGIIAALKGSAVPAAGIIPEGLIGYDAGLTLKRNTAAAAQLLNAAGYGPHKKKLNLLLTLSNGDADEALVASIMKSDLASLNINLQVQPLEWQTQWDKGKSTDPTKRQDIFLFYWYPDYADPYSWFINLYHSASPPYFNLSYYRNSTVDRTIDSLEALTATNRGKAETTYHQLQQTLLHDAVSVPLYVQNYQRLYAKSLTGYVDNPAYANVVFVYDVRPSS